MNIKIHYKQKINFFGEILYQALCGQCFCGVGFLNDTLQTRDKKKVDCKTCRNILRKKK